MLASTKCLLASLIFAAAVVTCLIQGKQLQGLFGTAIVAILLSASWICQAIERSGR